MPPVTPVHPPVECPAESAPSGAQPAGYGGDRWDGTKALIVGDYRAMLRHFNVGERPSLARRLYWMLLPSFLGLALYRLSHLAYVREWRNLARFIYLVKVYLTRMEISPQTVIGPELVISHAIGVTLDGHIGARCHIYGQCNTGRGFGERDVGAGPGLPVIGDDVVFSYGCMVLGGVRVGQGARIGPGAVVTTDVPAGALVMWTMPRFVQGGASSATPAARNSVTETPP